MTAELFGRVAFIVVFSAFTAMRIRFKRTYRVPLVASVAAEEGRRFSVVKLALTVVAAAATVSYVAPGPFRGLAPDGRLEWLVGARRGFDFAFSVRAIGLVVCLAAAELIRLAHRALGTAFRTVGSPRPDVSLVTRGLYAIVRNPMYGAYLVLFGGAFALTGDWLLCGSSMGIIVLLIAVRLPREEHLLAERYGDAYRAYRETTPRLIPALRLRKSTRGEPGRRAPSGAD